MKFIYYHYKILMKYDFSLILSANVVNTQVTISNNIPCNTYKNIFEYNKNQLFNYVSLTHDNLFDICKFTTSI